ncbi:1,3-beta-glucanosyltransferase GAS1 [Kluyveromyces lactis]|uniref:1,3-beta-glucanosyltransferase n=1 Tax=Kluyveromyces lactis (strain ATCC 8585 / CBS 2359 / DSM 70799 / NBRC 1267 / NRRL Y-1140 / WM37) TaxID=284590 RepID=Q6CTA9_KLULA|nr:uncharacterized protein KLLA0_C14091g [Kluyveromyces lactis]CAH01681.1 KLLA0C14091p [Kluyveromyces lactis]|eukprot:XP_452830.1 uncharacterized protein KLLA0_C14091g [Kluyveromyces lactis]
MLFSKLVVASFASLLSKVVFADDLPAVEVYGSKFFYSNNGSQFYLKGIAYQADSANATSGSTIVDPLGDFDVCSRDIPYMEKVATNVIRVYALNTSLDHTECMQALNDAGIYVIADLAEPSYSINRDSPKWNLELYERYTSVVDKFANYTNVLGFFAGNEVTNNSTNTDASPFVKAAIRDTKQYIKDQGYRSIPVGYSSNDDADTRVAIADYFACGDDDVKADFYGINMYEWCGTSTFEESGYADRTDEFKNLTIPVFFSEYGCIEVRPRKFQDVAALYGENMTDVWSGGIVYMYFEEENNYGLVSVDGSSVSTLADYSYYSEEINSISPTYAQSASYTPTSTSLACPATGRYWKAATDLPPTPNEDLCECMSSSLTCVVADDVDSDDYQALFDYICGEIDCTAITSNGTTGEYGSYSFCNSKDQLSFVMNLYWIDQDQSSSACDFEGKASLKDEDPTVQSGCSAALSAIGTEGTGTYTGSVTFTGGSSTSTSTGTRSSSSGSSSSSSNSSSSASSSSDSKDSSGVYKTNVPLYSVLTACVVTIFTVAGAGLIMI